MAEKLSTKMRKVVERDFHGVKLSLESGWVAKQAGGAVIVRAGETMVLVTVCRANPREGIDFFPLTVEYVEKTYAAGRIPGGFFRREARPGVGEILSARLIDRPIRPMFDDHYFDEVQIICTVMSYDGTNLPDVLAIFGASAALTISEIPFQGPIAGIRVGRVNGKLVINPGTKALETSDLDLVLAGSKDSIVMVEAGANFIPEKEILDALFFGHEQMQTLLEMQEELRKLVGKEKLVVTPPVKNEALHKKVAEFAAERVKKGVRINAKHERNNTLSAIESEAAKALAVEFVGQEKEIKKIVHDLIKVEVRQMILKEGRRVDGRDLTTVRPIEVELGVIPRAHGSAMFTRGETQAIVTTTLGTSMDAQKIDNLEGFSERRFMLHYNFPPFSTGEAKMMRGTGRREIGHGALAQRALEAILPEEKDFPYVIRVVSEITESNGSSSMASVCGGSLALMDAGVKSKSSIAGVAMGLIKEKDGVAVLTDILGDEDHFGDMDFKVAGNREGVTGIQMDIKCDGLNRETMSKALEQARQGRLHILDAMEAAITKPRDTLSQYAPQIQSIKINPDKIRDIIGPGGKTIRSITESTGCKIDINDDGTVSIASADAASAQRAIEIIKGLTEEAEIGRVYMGVVKRVVDFGAFVEILPGVEGLVHISQLEEGRVERVTDVINEGDEVPVRVLDIDRQGRIRLSRKEAMGAELN